MKATQNIEKWMKFFLGTFLILYALNQFLHFINTGYGVMAEDTGRFLDAVVIYLPYLYFFEIVIGLFLILNKWASFILIVLFPLTISFLMFNIINADLITVWPALIVGFLNVALIILNKKNYKPLFD